MRKILAPDNVVELHARYMQEGVSLLTVEQESGHLRNRLKRWFTEANLPMKSRLQTVREINNRGRKLVPNRVELKDAYDNNSIKHLEKKYGVGQETIYLWLKSADLEIKTLGQAVSAGKTRSFIKDLKDHPSIEDLYKELGYNKGALARELNLTRHGINYLFERDGIETVLPQRSDAEIKLFENIKAIDRKGEWRSSDKILISPFELDIVSEKRKMAVEYCGLYWHSEMSSGKSPLYHRDKMRTCTDIGIQLLTIFDTDQMYKVLGAIHSKLGLSPVSIGARECIVRKGTKEEVQPFENEYHLQNTLGASHRYVLEYDGEIVSAMTFARPRFSKKFEWEMGRYTCRPDINVSGGAGKLFSAFKKDINPNTVMTYTDLRFGTGKVYERIGFTYSHSSSPNYWYHKEYTGPLHHRVGFQKHRLEKILSTFDPTLTEWQNVSADGWDRIWDCGNAVWTWSKAAKS